MRKPGGYSSSCAVSETSDKPLSYYQPHLSSVGHLHVDIPTREVFIPVEQELPIAFYPRHLEIRL